MSDDVMAESHNYDKVLNLDIFRYNKNLDIIKRK